MANPWGYGFKSPSAPNSQVVQSDEEFLSPFRQRLQEAQQAAASTPTINENWQDAARTATGFYGVENQGIVNGWLDGLIDPNGTNKEFYRNALANGNNGGMWQGRETALAGFDNYNPRVEQGNRDAAIGLAQEALTEQTGMRAENSQRQTQSYGQMQGGNFFGGMMNEGYSDPFSGQVGGPGGTVGGLGGLGGMPTAPTQNANYNASWQPEQKQFRAGAWGSPFGGGN